MPYADNMPELMCASDLVVSRAGAIAVSEIAVCGKPSVLVPSPNVTDNHQFYNAKAVADADAAVLIEEKDLPEGEDKLAEAVLALASDKERLSAMSAAAKKLARPDAADIIYKELGLDA
jgi:UDP-N-acetylglucosamine--N-acetylmuramyl-(pentapeptide) pyrophosphoryl-undecaprenol N-acetylglucosamine transferase